MTGRLACRLTATLLFVGGVVGCTREATRGNEAPVNRGDASWHAVEQPDTVHYQLALGEVSSGATVFQRVRPVYPVAQLKACPPMVGVTVQLVVDTAGRVSDVRPANTDARVPALKPYLEATRAAAMQWRFNPLQINHWAADAHGESHLVDSRTLPFSLDYVFRFSCQAGRVQVSGGDAVARGRAR